MPKEGITEKAFQDAAKDLGVEVAAIKAVDEVESRGAGFLKDGHVKILFERHKFHEFTHGKYDLSHPNISNPVPGGYGPTSAQYARFSKAFALNPQAAMKSASWGRFQIMGFNYKSAGFTAIDAFVDAMKRSEDEHLKAFVNVIRDWGLADELQRHNWAEFARRYNGKGYKKNKYDTKMADAYEKYKNQPSIEIEPDEPPAGVVDDLQSEPKIEEPENEVRTPPPRSDRPNPGGTPTAAPSASPQPEGITVQKVVQSLGSKVLAGGTVVMGALTALGGAFLGVINNPYAFAIVIVGCAALGVYAWNKSKDRQLELQLDLNEKAASKDLHTVKVSGPPPPNT